MVSLVPLRFFFKSCYFVWGKALQQVHYWNEGLCRYGVWGLMKFLEVECAQVSSKKIC
jgi:hypothetical protein